MDTDATYSAIGDSSLDSLSTVSPASYDVIPGRSSEGKYTLFSRHMVIYDIRAIVSHIPVYAESKGRQREPRPETTFRPYESQHC